MLIFFKLIIVNMLQTVNNTEFSRAMDLFKEIDDLSDLFFPEKNDKLDSTAEGLEDLQNKYSSLHETYAKEIENSKKVEKCLIKCLKFYSKLCKKYEVQQKIIRDLEESIKEKVSSLEEAHRNEEKLKGLIEVYRTERTLYAGQTSAQLRKEKEILIDICCKLIGESVKSNNISNVSNMLLRKFKKDLDSEKMSLLKSKSIKLKDEVWMEYDDLKPDFKAVKDEVVFKFEDKYEVRDPGEESKTNLLDLKLCKEVVEERSLLVNENSSKSSDGIAVEDSDSEDMSNLPLLDEFPASLQSPNNERQHECDVAINEEFDSHRKESVSDKLPSFLQIPNHNLTNNNVGRVLEPQNSKEFSPPVSPLDSHTDVPFLPGKGSTSVFDISGFGEHPTEKEKQEYVSVANEVPSFFDSEERSEALYFESCIDRVNNSDVVKSDGDSSFPYEEELLKIFREMTSVRLLSPIRESCSSVISDKKNSEEGSSGSSLKRNASVEENHCKSKKIKPEEAARNGCFLDSILSAMSIQNEEFKSKKYEDKGLRESDGTAYSVGCSSEFERMDTGARRRKRNESCRAEENPAAPCRSVRRSKDSQGVMEKLVSEEIRNFVSSPMSCKEDADKNVRHCISVLKNKPEDVISKCIVATVFENIDEAVEIFERPAPPLTKTQHRLIVLLSVLRTLEWDFEKISSKILSLITEKLFPDDFFWPDDSVEAAVRFYAALCRARNDPKTLWKFCLSAMTDMRQRCPLLVFTVLKTWPDVLHDASTLKNNMLAVTVVNIFLHMPKTDGLRNVNQRRKLVALKHLLMNFYQFKVDDTIEGFAKKVLDAVHREEVGSEKSIVLLCMCRDLSWTMKNVMPALRASLTDWAEEKLGDSVATTILSVIKHICPLLTQEGSVGEKVKDLAVSLSEILSSRKKSHNSELNLIEILLLLKHFPEARKVIREWIPKNPICDSLRNEIINASAENILRELKLNRREPKNVSVKKKSWKKSKGKKKKGKKGKKNDQKLKVCSRSQA